MTNQRPRYDNPWGKILASIFLLFVGGLINQFWNIPRQRAQIEALRADVVEMRKQVFFVNTPKLNLLSDQHMIIMAEQARQAKLLRELNDRLDNHDRRTRNPHK